MKDVNVAPRRTQNHGLTVTEKSFVLLEIAEIVINPAACNWKLMPNAQSRQISYYVAECAIVCYMILAAAVKGNMLALRQWVILCFIVYCIQAASVRDAQRQSDRGNHELAAQLYEQVDDLRSDVYTWLDYAMVLGRIGRYNDAIKEFKAILAQDAPYKQQIWYNMGFTYQEAGRLPDAASAYEQVSCAA